MVRLSAVDLGARLADICIACSPALARSTYNFGPASPRSTRLGRRTAIASNLLSARLAQPTQSLCVQSVYSRAFGPAEWQLLEARLGEWKATIDEVKGVVDESLALAAAQEEQGARGAGGGGERRERRGFQPAQSQSQVAA